LAYVFICDSGMRPSPDPTVGLSENARQAYLRKKKFGS
jgi:hypothetical protein